MLGRTFGVLLILAGIPCGSVLSFGAEPPASSSWEQSVERGKRLWAQGNLVEAEAVLQEALQQAQSSGRNQLAMGVNLNGLGSVYQDLGKFGEAEQYYQRSIVTLEGALGKEDANLASPLHNLADLYMETGRYKDAEDLLRRSLSIRTAALGGEHPDVAMTLNNLGALCRLEHKWQEAERPLKEALAVFKKRLGPFDLRVAEVLSNLGRLYQDTLVDRADAPVVALGTYCARVDPAELGDRVV